MQLLQTSARCFPQMYVKPYIIRQHGSKMRKCGKVYTVVLSVGMV